MTLDEDTWQTLAPEQWALSVWAISVHEVETRARKRDDMRASRGQRVRPEAQTREEYNAKRRRQKAAKRKAAAMLRPPPKTSERRRAQIRESLKRRRAEAKRAKAGV